MSKEAKKTKKEKTTMVKTLPPESPTRIQPKRTLAKEAAAAAIAAATKTTAPKRKRRPVHTYRSLVLAGIKDVEAQTKKKGAGLMSITEYVKGQLTPRITHVQTKVKRALEAAVAAGIVTQGSKRRYRLADKDEDDESEGSDEEKETTTKKRKKAATAKKKKCVVTKEVVEKQKRAVTKKSKKSGKRGSGGVTVVAEDAKGKKGKAAVAKRKAKKDEAQGKVKINNKHKQSQTQQTNKQIVAATTLYQHTNFLCFFFF